MIKQYILIAVFKQVERVVGSNPICDSEFFSEFFMVKYQMHLCGFLIYY